MKVMVFAAHPDDEIIGVGGALAKHVRQGDSVSAVIMAEENRPEKKIMKNLVIRSCSIPIVKRNKRLARSA